MDRIKKPANAAQRSDLIDRMHARLAYQFAREDVGVAAKAILESIVTALAEGRSVTVRGFGRLTVHVKSAGMRNPRTGEPVTSARKYVRFRPYPPLIEAIQPRGTGEDRRPPRPAAVPASQVQSDLEATAEPVG